MERMTDRKDIVMNNGEALYKKQETKLKRDKDGGHFVDRNSITDEKGRELLYRNI